MSDYHNFSNEQNPNMYGPYDLTSQYNSFANIPFNASLYDPGSIIYPSHLANPDVQRPSEQESNFAPFEDTLGETLHQNSLNLDINSSNPDTTGPSARYSNRMVPTRQPRHHPYRRPGGTGADCPSTGDPHSGHPQISLPPSMYSSSHELGFPMQHTQPLQTTSSFSPDLSDNTHHRFDFQYQHDQPCPNDGSPEYNASNVVDHQSSSSFPGSYPFPSRHEELRPALERSPQPAQSMIGVSNFPIPGLSSNTSTSVLPFFHPLPTSQGQGQHHNPDLGPHGYYDSKFFPVYQHTPSLDEGSQGSSCRLSNNSQPRPSYHTYHSQSMYPDPSDTQSRHPASSLSNQHQENTSSSSQSGHSYHSMGLSPFSTNRHQDPFSPVSLQSGGSASTSGAQMVDIVQAPEGNCLNANANLAVSSTSYVRDLGGSMRVQGGREVEDLNLTRRSCELQQPTFSDSATVDATGISQIWQEGKNSVLTDEKKKQIYLDALRGMGYNTLGAVSREKCCLQRPDLGEHKVIRYTRSDDNSSVFMCHTIRCAVSFTPMRLEEMQKWASRTSTWNHGHLNKPLARLAVKRSQASRWTKTRFRPVAYRYTMTPTADLDAEIDSAISQALDTITWKGTVLTDKWRREAKQMKAKKGSEHTG